MVRSLVVALATLAFTVGVAPSRASAEFVDLELVLAVDASSSVNYDEFSLQLNGLAAAFGNPLLIKALESAAGQGGIAVSLMQWSDTNKQQLAIGW